jgi:hypothetical protein
MRICGLALLMVCTLPSTLLAAPTVYSGYDVSFTKPANANPNAPANQDFLVSDVILTRGSTAGMFNVALETSYTSTVSPEGTAWAFQANNAGLTIAAANWAALTFAPWEVALGGPGNLATNILDGSGVLHLIDDDIYLDIRFTDWGVGSPQGGRFTYERAAIVPVPEPSSLMTLALASLGILSLRRF